MTLRGTEDHAKTRLLLALWEMSNTQAEVKKSDLTKRSQRKDEKASDYQPILEALDKAGAIALKDKMVKFHAKGHQLLAEGLKAESFEFDANIGAKTANALLHWIRQSKSASTNGNGKKATIASYEEFKPVALEVFDRLNHTYSLDNLVPIYRLRREIGEQVERSQFDEWLLKLQTQDALQLIGGEMPELTPEKAEDSIKTTLGSIRYYAKRL